MMNDEFKVAAVAAVMTVITAASLMKKEPKGGAEQEDARIMGREK